jgi:hypothetical protein
MALSQPLEELSQQLARYEILCEDIMDKLREQPEDLQFHYNKLSNSSFCAKSGQRWLPDDEEGYILQLTSQCEATPSTYEEYVCLQGFLIPPRDDA